MTNQAQEADLNQTSQEQSPVVTNSTSPVHVTAEKRICLIMKRLPI